LNDECYIPASIALVAMLALGGIGIMFGYNWAYSEMYQAKPPKVIYVDPIPGEPSEITVNGKEGRIILRQKEAK
jgi:hypothetical protein